MHKTDGLKLDNYYKYTKKGCSMSKLWTYMEYLIGGLHERKN